MSIVKKFDFNEALFLDNNDVLSNYRNQFFFPKKNNKKCLYFSGNSLGLQPKVVREYINSELEDSERVTIIFLSPWMQLYLSC